MQHPLSKEDQQVDIFTDSQKKKFDIYRQSKDIADFYNLQGKLESMTLTTYN